MSENGNILFGENIKFDDQSRKLTIEEISDVIKYYMTSNKKKRLEMYNNYYMVFNTIALRRFQNKKARDKTPNHLIPTAYYATLTDSMAGYMFQNVQYEAKTEEDEEYAKEINAVLNDNNTDVKDMATGLNSLAFNQGVELVYTTGDGESTAEIKYASLDPREIIPVYTTNIEPDLYCAIRYYHIGEDTFSVEIIYKDEWQFYKYHNSEIRIDPMKKNRKLFFNEVPVCIYNSELLNDLSPFHQIIPYIDALDALTSGNSNEIDRLVDAILVLGQQVDNEKLKEASEWRVLQGMSKEDRAEYISKDMSHEFRKYVTDLLIREIHKHSHVIDWYSSELSSSGDASAKALRTRLFDMDMFSQKIEKIYKEGAEKRIRLIASILEAQGVETGKINIIYNRTVPSDFEDKVQVLSGVDFLSQQTKVEKVGLDWDVEKIRKEDEINGIILENDTDRFPDEQEEDET